MYNIICLTKPRCCMWFSASSPHDHRTWTGPRSWRHPRGRRCCTTGKFVARHHRWGVRDSASAFRLFWQILAHMAPWSKVFEATLQGQLCWFVLPWLTHTECQCAKIWAWCLLWLKTPLPQHETQFAEFYLRSLPGNTLSLWTLKGPIWYGI